MSTLVSIIVPAYNIAPYLAGCLDSILAQTHRELEIIVVNDGSTDDTAQVLERYAAQDSRIRAIHKDNGGVTTARLTGLAAAMGEWIGFVDGDDYVEPDMFERLLHNALQYDADISHCGYRMVFPSGRADYYYNTGRVVPQDTAAGLKDLLSGSFVEPGLCNKLFRKPLIDALLQSDIMDIDIKINEDLLMNYYLFKEADASVFEDICPYHYLLRKGSAATSKLNEHKLKDPLRVLQRLYEDTAQQAELQDIVLGRIVYQMINTATVSLGDQKELIKPYRREVRKALRQKLPTILKGSACHRKIKLMAAWAAIWPASYRWFHSVYGKLTGSAHKYDI